MTNVWLNIIGIGENGLNGLSKSSIECIKEAKIVFGSKRHLQLARIREKGKEWPSPFSYEEVFKYKKKKVVILASGDPFWFGIGSRIVEQLESGEWRCYPNYSTFSLAASKLGWAIQETECTAIHAKPVEVLNSKIKNGRRSIILCKDFRQLVQVFEWLKIKKLKTSRFILMSRLGSAQELVMDLSENNINDLKAREEKLEPLALGIELNKKSSHLSLFSGLRNENFKSDGNITKQPIRAITMSELQTFGNEVLWDIGAGSGTISVEWCLTNQNNTAYAIENRADRISFIEENIKQFGLQNRIFVMQGSFENFYKKLPKPDAVFIGGGASDELISKIIRLIPKKGRLVVNGVTLETQQLIIDKQKNFGGSLKKIEISNSRKLGSKSIWEPSSPIVQWSYLK